MVLLLVGLCVLRLCWKLVLSVARLPPRARAACCQQQQPLAGGPANKQTKHPPFQHTTKPAAAEIPHLVHGKVDQVGRPRARPQRAESEQRADHARREQRREADGHLRLGQPRRQRGQLAALIHRVQEGLFFFVGLCLVVDGEAFWREGGVFGWFVGGTNTRDAVFGITA